MIRSDDLREGMMQAATGTSRKWLNELPEKVVDNDGINHKVWTFKKPFCTIHYINDTLYLP